MYYGVGKRMHRQPHLPAATTDATAAEPSDHETRHGCDWSKLGCGNSVETQIKVAAQVRAESGVEPQSPPTATLTASDGQ